MASIVVKAKTKKQEKALKAFLEMENMEYRSALNEDAALYEITKPNKKKNQRKLKTPKEKLVEEIKEAVKQINLIKQGKLKARPIQELLDEL